MACRSWRKRKILKSRDTSKPIRSRMSKSRSSKNPLNEGKCHFCRSDKEDEVNLGKLYRTDEVNVHYYCLLFASGLEQRGEDDCGIMGFLSDDIQRELKRGQKLRCCFCKHNGATIGCSERNCSIKFHLPCGLKNNTLHIFFELFSSYCARHRPFQKPLPHEKKGDLADCRICLNPASAYPNCDSLRAPCCKSWFHRDCLQQQALNSGYFFKCPLCNNTESFLTEMKNFGIYIPEQDASWELEENAFQELHERHSSCDHKFCRCLNGRNFNKDGSSWEIILCEICGSKGCHLICGRMKWQNPIWECDECKEILQKDNSREENHCDDSQKKNTKSQVKKVKKRKRKPLPKKRTKKTFIQINDTDCVRLSKEDSDIEIDIEDSSDEENTASQSSKTISGNSSVNSSCNLSDIDSYSEQHNEPIFISDSDSDSDVEIFQSESNSSAEIIVIDDSETESNPEVSVIKNSLSVSASSYEGAGCSNWKNKTNPVNSPAGDNGNSSDNCVYKRGDTVNINNSTIELFKNSESGSILKITLKQPASLSNGNQQFTGAGHFPCNIRDFYRSLLSQFSGQKKSSVIFYESDPENSV